MNSRGPNLKVLGMNWNELESWNGLKWIFSSFECRQYAKITIRKFLDNDRTIIS